jgi:hypothetical protein
MRIRNSPETNKMEQIVSAVQTYFNSFQFAAIVDERRNIIIAFAHYFQLLSEGTTATQLCNVQIRKFLMKVLWNKIKSKTYRSRESILRNNSEESRLNLLCVALVCSRRGISSIQHGWTSRL